MGTSASKFLSELVSAYFIQFHWIFGSRIPGCPDNLFNVTYRFTAPNITKAKPLQMSNVWGYYQIIAKVFDQAFSLSISAKRSSLYPTLSKEKNNFAICWPWKNKNENSEINLVKHTEFSKATDTQLGKKIDVLMF